FFVIALALGLASDVFLMLPRDMFVAGLVAALVEHLAYIAGFPRCSWSWSPAREVADLSSRWRERCCSSIRTQSWRGIGSSSRSRWVASSTSFPTMRGSSARPPTRDMTIAMDDFERLDMRVGVIIDVEDLPAA